MSTLVRFIVQKDQCFKQNNEYKIHDHLCGPLVYGMFPCNVDDHKNGDNIRPEFAQHGYEWNVLYANISNFGQKLNQKTAHDLVISNDTDELSIIITLLQLNRVLVLLCKLKESAIVLY